MNQTTISRSGDEGASPVQRPVLRYHGGKWLLAPWIISHFPELSLTEHFALAKTLKSIKGKAILSGYASELYDRDLYADWSRVEKVAQASGQHGRIQRVEVLWANFPLQT